MLCESVLGLQIANFDERDQVTGGHLGFLDFQAQPRPSYTLVQKFLEGVGLNFH